MAYKRISPQPVVEGGTGAQTFTLDGVLIGNTTSAIGVTSAGTTGQVLTGVTGSAPTFQSPAASSISITGNSGGALTGAAFTLTGGTTGLTFAGAGSTETLGGTLAIANGGTNATSMTNTDGVVYYDGTRLVTTAVGTATQVLTSNGAGVAPTFQAAGGSGVTSITGTTGGAQTGAITLSGGTTGLAYGGSAGTITSTFAGITANGGTVSLATDATNSTINIGTGGGIKTTTLGSTNTSSSTIIKSGSGNVAINSGLTIDSTGRNYNTVQPAFLATPSGVISNVTGDGTAYTVVWDSEIFDQNNNFDATSTFTAPITGRYILGTTILGQQLITTMDRLTVITTSNRPYRCDNNAASFTGNTQDMAQVLADMDAADTAIIQYVVSGGTKVVDIYSGGVSDPRSNFYGYLAC